ncbi:Holliday junction branch migration protein RuvA [Planctomycetota bacterium]
MIAQIEGRLISLDDHLALVQVGAVAYEVMLPAYTAASLTGQSGTDILLCTMEYYEGTLGGGNLVPRMIGFLSPAERAFFTKFTSVKGLGIKKGLKALSMPIAEIASAIETGNEKMLTALAGIGKRMSQQIVAELQGKLTAFALDTPTPVVAKGQLTDFQTEALEILIAWGEKRNEAAELIELACERHPEIETAETLVPLVYRLKQGVET